MFEPRKGGNAMWTRKDWHQYYHLAGTRWHRMRPLRPLDRGVLNRLVPAEGYSLAELDDAGITIEQAEGLGLPVDAGRVGSYGPNVSELREFVRAARARV
jgi:ribosomal protein L13E